MRSRLGIHLDVDEMRTRIIHDRSSKIKGGFLGAGICEVLEHVLIASYHFDRTERGLEIDQESTVEFSSGSTKVSYEHR